jgi:hypothetical protein
LESVLRIPVARYHFARDWVTKWLTIATDSSGRQSTSTDGLSQATRVAALVARAATWLRDEEAGASLANREL